MVDLILADTYALVEIIKGNKNYSRFANYQHLTTKISLSELYYYLLRIYDEDKANSYLLKYWDFIISLTQNAISKGMKYKYGNKKERLSYADCLGYQAAQELGIRFLTGDEKFRDKENVEFVK